MLDGAFVWCFLIKLPTIFSEAVGSACLCGALAFQLCSLHPHLANVSTCSLLAWVLTLWSVVACVGLYHLDHQFNDNFV